MGEVAHFRYAQARLQARHGARPDESVWRRLQGIGDLANYLQVARQTPLQPWVNGLQARHSSHKIELALRHLYRSHVDDVRSWLPARWSATVQLLRRVPDLPALQHLMAGNPATAWMLDDPELQPFSSDNLTLRKEALQNSDCAWLLRAWQGERALFDIWYDNWQRKWPEVPRLTAGLEYLGRLLQSHIQALRQESGALENTRREALMHRLEAGFRRYSFQPAAAVAHLALIALDMERLRADLVSRRLFAESLEQSA